MVILLLKKNYNKIKIRKYTNKNYYDVCYFILVNSYLFQDIILFCHKNCELSGEINLETCIIEKSK